MSAAVFLLIAVGLSVLGSLIMWAWTSWPRGENHSINEFSRNRQALAPEQGDRQSDADYFGL